MVIISQEKYLRVVEEEVAPVRKADSLDHFLEDAVEEWMSTAFQMANDVVGAVLEHVELAGIPGIRLFDSHLQPEAGVLKQVKHAHDLAACLRVCSLMNIQLRCRMIRFILLK